MTQSITEALSESARAAVKANAWQRDQEAWNLPRASTATATPEHDGHKLDWQQFSAANYPGSRRHNLEAIVAYGMYRGSVVVDGYRPVEAWEDEGGAAQ